MCIISFGEGADFLVLQVHGRVKPDCQSYWDANWLYCTADVSVGSVPCKVEWQLRNEDLARFTHALENLREQAGEALLDTGDGWLDVQVTRDEHGRIEAQCQVEDNCAGGAPSEFHLFLHEKDVAILLDQLREVLGRFPVLGPD